MNRLSKFWRMQVSQEFYPALTKFMVSVRLKCVEQGTSRLTKWLSAPGADLLFERPGVDR